MIARQTVWMPTQQGFPDHGGQVLVSWKWHGNSSGPFVSACRYEMGHWDWNSLYANQHRESFDVQAWMDMPEPYDPSAL